MMHIKKSETFFFWASCNVSSIFQYSLLLLRVTSLFCMQQHRHHVCVARGTKQEWCANTERQADGAAGHSAGMGGAPAEAWRERGWRTTNPSNLSICVSVWDRVCVCGCVFHIWGLCGVIKLTTCWTLMWCNLEVTVEQHQHYTLITFIFSWFALPFLFCLVNFWFYLWDFP